MATVLVFKFEFCAMAFCEAAVNSFTVKNNRQRTLKQNESLGYIAFSRRFSVLNA